MNNIFKPKNFILFFIVALGFMLRFYNLGEVPPSLNWDENSNAYNAYSILKTGRDEYSNFLPLYNRSFDDFKPPLYMYLNVITVWMFGLNSFAARLPSAIFGTLTLIPIYFLAKFLFQNQKSANVELASIASVLVFAISPWHIHFSRVGFEANVGLFTAVCAITFFLYGIRNIKYLILSALFVGLSAYSYHSVRIYLPLLLLVAVIIYRHQLKTIPRKAVLFFLTGIFVLVVPLFVFTPFSSISQRYKTTTNELRREETEKAISFIKDDQEAAFPFGEFIHNRRVFAVLTLIDNYLWHFDPNFLFTKGDDNFRHHIDNQGMMYLWQLPLLVYGVFLFVKNRNAGFIFVLLWLLIVPLAAAPARPSPHAVRSLAMVVPLSLITGLVLARLASAAKYLIAAKITFVLFCLALLFSLVSYEHNYHVHYPLEKASFWQYGYNLAAEKTEKIKDDYKKIRIDGRLEQAYIFWLFTTRYDPSLYQQTGNRNAFDKYIFDSPWPKDPNELYVTVPPEKIPFGFEIIETINQPNGTAAIIIGKFKGE